MKTHQKSLFGSLFASMFSLCGCGQTPLSPHAAQGEPTLAEDNGTESESESFELIIQEVLGVPVVRAEREVFVIQNPAADTAHKAKSWLAAFHNNNVHSKAVNGSRR